MQRTIIFLWLVTAGSALMGQGAIPDTWWNNAVFYEIFVRSFNDSDGDGIGDFQGIIQKLDYLNDGDPNTTDDLGITGIWLMPINPTTTYHGYDVTDYFGINPEYGTAADFQQLLAACDDRGIKVIVDFVGNHASSQHPRFLSAAANISSPYRDHFLWSETNPGAGWHFNNGSWYYGLFWSEMPDWNVLNPEVVDYHYSIVDYWLEEVGVAGFRYDAVKHLVEGNGQNENLPGTFDYLEGFYNHYKAVDNEAICVGEVWSNTSTIAQYGPPHQDFCFEFGLANGLRNAANSLDPNALLAAMAEVELYHQPGAYAPFLTNHDQDRIFGQLGGDVNKMKLASAMLLTLPGVPFLYYGEEIGMTGSGADPNKRTPMQWANGPQGGFTTGTPWMPLNNDVDQVNVAAQDGAPGSLLEHYRELVHLRMAEPALRLGGFQAWSSTNPNLLPYVRSTEADNILVLHNLAPGPTSNVTLFAEGLCGSSFDVTNLRTGEVFPAQSIATGNAWTLPESIEAYGTQLYRLSPTATETCTYAITLSSDLFNETISPSGIHLAGSFNNWDPAATPCTADGSVYSATVEVEAGSTITYRFVNGDTPAGLETVPASCGVDDGMGNYNRQFTVGTENASAPVRCFGACTPCELPPAELTFQVDLGDLPPSPDGVHIAGNWQGWDPSATAMTNTSGTVWTYTATFDANSYLEYKFVNGNAWGVDEAVPGACAAGLNRFHTTGGADETLEPLCFGSCALCPAADVPGCTDPVACNYDTTATVDDGSCEYGCEGCADPNACNYDPNATGDFGFCDYSCVGCTDPLACNFGPQFWIDDGSCDYTCEGCTYPSALNYNAAAVTDDGTCMFGPQYCGEGTYWDADSQTCLASSGPLCMSDLDNNGTVGTSDLLVLLSDFGTACE